MSKLEKKLYALEFDGELVDLYDQSHAITNPNIFIRILKYLRTKV